MSTKAQIKNKSSFLYFYPEMIRVESLVDLAVYTEKKYLIESKKIICLNDFLWFKEIICLNQIKFVWFKQNIFEPNKYLFESN